MRLLDEQDIDTSIKNNEDLLMNYYLFCRSNKTVYDDVCPYHYLVRNDSASRRKLNRHMIWDPIRVREMILKSCETGLRIDAEKALQHIMDVLNQSLFDDQVFNITNYTFTKNGVKYTIISHDTLTDKFEIVVENNKMMMNR